MLRKTSAGYEVDIHPTSGLFSNEEQWAEDVGVVRMHHVNEPKGANSGVGIEFRPGFAFTFNTYMTPSDARCLGEALALMTGCGWYDPQDDLDNTDV